MNQTAIHISDVRTYRSCRRKWNWSSPLRQNLEPAVPYVPFFTGKAFHASLEYYYRDGIPFEETLDKYLESEEANLAEIGSLWPQEALALEEQTELIRDMIDHYKLWQQGDRKKFADINLKFISLEQAFDVPMPTPQGPHPTLRLAGRFDGIVQHVETGEYWIWETKTSRSISELVRSLANDEQCREYMYAASQMLPYPVVGVLYNIVRKKAPTMPTVLKNGLLSKASSIDTTAFHFLMNVRDSFPDWSDETITDEYGELLLKLMENESKFFLRFPVRRNDHEIEVLMQGIYETALEMVNPDLPLYPAPSWVACNFCSFRSPCVTMNAGGNYNVLLEAEFTNRTHNVSMRPEEPQGDVE